MMQYFIKNNIDTVMSENCQICVENAKLIPCSACNYEACKTCIKRFILEKESDIGTCMNCNTAYTRATMVDMLGITFVKDVFTKHQHKVRINRHKLVLPSLQPIAEKQIKIEDLEKDIAELTKIIFQKKEEIFTLNTTKKTAVEIKYIRPCSVANCNGFLNTNWSCGICSIKTCKDCFETILDDEHVCKDESKATAALIKKDTKCCPKCGTGIYKIEGCDQMWCTNCQTAFSWKTGKIEEGRIHNPHYFNHLRAMAVDGEIRREEGDVLPNQQQCIADITRQYTYYPNSIIKLCEYLSVISPNSGKLIELLDAYTEMVRYYYHIEGIKTNMILKETSLKNTIKDVGVLFIRNKVTSDYYENTIKKSQKKKEIIDEKIMLINTLCDVIKEILVSMFNSNIEPLYTTLNTYKGIIYLAKSKVNEFPEQIKILFEDMYRDFKQNYLNYKKEVSHIINYCLEEDKKIASLYSSKSYLDIAYRANYKFLSVE
jgi:hypothetical protein